MLDQRQIKRDEDVCKEETHPMKMLSTCLLLSLSLILHIKAETKVVLELENLPEFGESMVWSPLFQATWDKWNEQHKGKPIKVEPENKLKLRCKRV
ncbi:MAG: hypothetical protein QMC23_08460 [Rubritalea sp.]|tara:strand:+ start:100 stop:387 length:288 start_codon:yes stop_codon:yes gene_type:complete